MLERIIGRTKNGHVIFCMQCDMIHLEFKNINFNFRSIEEYEDFAACFLGYWEELNHHTLFGKEIIVPSGISRFNVLLTYEELKEFRDLLNGKICCIKEPLKASIEYFCEN